MASPDFRKQTKRQAVLSEIAKVFDISAMEVKRKIRSLRATYLLERRKVLASEQKIRDGLGQFVYEPILVWYKYMSFLDDIIVFRTPTAIENGTSDGIESQTEAKYAEAEDCQETLLEKVEEIYYDNDGKSRHENAAEMSAEYLEAKYLSEEPEEQIDSVHVADDVSDFFEEGCEDGSTKADEESMGKDNSELDRLKAERIRAETDYFRKKTEYIDMCIQKEKKLQPFLIAKLKLEIRNLERRSNT